MSEGMHRPIPKKEFPNIGETKLFRKIESMILLQDLKDDRIVHDPVYYNGNIEGAIPQCYFRQSVGERLQHAASQLPKGYKLKIFDAWRPAQVQMALYIYYRAQVAAKNVLALPEEIDRKTRLFVSYPSKDPLCPAPHSTGGAIDLTILDENAQEINMGTAFDDFSDAAHTAHYEFKTDCSHEDMCARDNRRFLYHIMTDAGFSNLPSEWWHYDYGNQFWGYYHEKAAFYGAFRK